MKAYQAEVKQPLWNLQLVRRGARPSYAIRRWHGIQRTMLFPTQIQHVVVIAMENRSFDDLLSGYYGQAWSHGGDWQEVMNIWNPAAPPPNQTVGLTPNSLAPSPPSGFDPNHNHNWFVSEAKCGFASPCEIFGCYMLPCPSNVTGYSYVPHGNPDETSTYAQLIENYASADEVYQCNQGPSMPSHQCMIAAQTGGIAGSTYAPHAIADNPDFVPPPPEPTVNYLETGDDPDGGGYAYCDSRNTLAAHVVNMTEHYPVLTGSVEGYHYPCQTYSSGTILDEMVGSKGNPPYDDWQYVSAQVGGYWAAPTAVANLYTQYSQGNFATQPFMVDPNGWNFYQNMLPNGHPTYVRPFALLTYITPCPNASDHPDTGGKNLHGPKWLGTLVNAIGESPYWSSTAIIVTWDDWGGFFDHAPMPAFPPEHIEAYPNAYPNLNGPPPNPADPNEWGFRVPLIIISPYVTAAGYVSHGPGGSLASPTPRSQSAILQFIETVFGVNSLGGDDSFSNDNLLDMFNFYNSLPFTPVQGLGGYTLPQSC